MSLSFEQKKTLVGEAEAALARSRAGVLAEYRGLTVEQMTELRTQARERGVWIKVLKNSLAKRVVDGSDFACLKESFAGPVIFSASEDPVAVAKVMADFAAEHDHLKITAGAMDGALIDRRTIGALAKLPGREELLAKLAGAMRAPAQQFASTLAEIPARFVRVLSAVADSKSKSDTKSDAKSGADAAA